MACLVPQPAATAVRTRWPNKIMNAAEFLTRFADVSDTQLHTLRRSSRLDEWPADQALYLGVTKELFPGPPEDWEGRQRFVQILCEFLYHDGRTFDALIYIVEQAFQAPQEYDSNGKNALAGIWCYLNCNGVTMISDATLVETFERFANIPALAHNAKNCRDLILQRRTDADDDNE